MPRHQPVKIGVHTLAFAHCSGSQRENQSSFYDDDSFDDDDAEYVNDDKCTALYDFAGQWHRLPHESALW